MTPRQIAEAVLLGIGVLSVLLSVIGIVLVKDFYERVHYVTPAATVGVASVVIAVTIEDSLSIATVKAIMVAAIVLAMNPVLTHATARAGRVRRLGQWEPRSSEEIEGLETDKKAKKNKKTPKKHRKRKRGNHPGDDRE